MVWCCVDSSLLQHQAEVKAAHCHTWSGAIVLNVSKVLDSRKAEEIK